MSYAPGTYYARNREKVLARVRTYHALNPQKARNRVKRFRAANPNRAKVYKIKSRYGVSEQQFLALKSAQEGCCAICHTIAEKLVIDHCHASGKVRGLLCLKCNTLLGMAEDSAQILRSAISYIETRGAKSPEEKHQLYCGPASS